MQDEFSVNLDEDDFIEAYRPPRRSQRIANLVLILAIMLGFLLVSLLVRFPYVRMIFFESPLICGLAGAVTLAATLVIFLLIATPALRRRAARSTLDDHPGMNNSIHYSVDPEQFAMRSTYTQARYPWAQLWDWRECERVLVIYPTPRNFYVIPKREIDLDVLERLRGYLAQCRKRVTTA